MADTNGRLLEVIAEMLVEIKGLNSKMDINNKSLASLDSRVERLEKHQATTNLLLQQHSIDIVKLDDEIKKTNSILLDHSLKLEKIERNLSERVPHYGEDITIETKNGPFTGLLRKAV